MHRNRTWKRFIKSEYYVEKNIFQLAMKTKICYSKYCKNKPKKEAFLFFFKKIVKKLTSKIS